MAEKLTCAKRRARSREAITCSCVASRSGTFATGISRIAERKSSTSSAYRSQSRHAFKCSATPRSSVSRSRRASTVFRTRSQIIFILLFGRLGRPLHSRRRIQLTRQFLPQSFPATHDPGLHGPNRYLQNLGNFFVTQIFDVPQNHHFTKYRIYLGQCRFDQ